MTDFTDLAASLAVMKERREQAARRKAEAEAEAAAAAAAKPTEPVKTELPVSPVPEAPKPAMVPAAVSPVDTPRPVSAGDAIAAPAEPPSHVETVASIPVFIADLVNVKPKGDMVTAEHPVYALRAGNMTPRKYKTPNGETLVVIPSGLGLATIHDKDILLYVISQIVEGLNNGRTPGRRVRIVAADLLRAIKRSSGKNDYQRFKDGLNRLRGTTLNTTIRTGSQIIEDSFGLIEFWRMVREDKSGRMIAIEIVLSEWTYNAVLASEVLTYNPAYYDLRGGLERRLYELGRKYCGRQPRWPCGLEGLKEKAGAGGRLADFRNDIKEIAKADPLPDYRLQYAAAKDQVVFYLRSEAGTRAEINDMIRSVPKGSAPN